LQATVILLQDDKPVSQFAVDEAAPVTVGRSAGNTIQVHDPKISRQHCEIRATPDGYFIRDLGSKNGTFVNGARVTEARLRNNDRMQVGLAHLLFRCEAPETEETGQGQTAPPHLCASCGKTIPIEALGSARHTANRVYCAACIGASPLVGRVIGRYEIVQPIGRGSIGWVYKAEQLSMNRLVALKVLRDELAASPEGVARFLRDIRTVGQFSHPNIIRIYDMGQADGIHFISMEYAQGGNLGSLLERHGPLPIKQVIELASAACDALAYAHAAGVVHGDLKPSNLLLTRDGILKVADLGVARSLGAAGLAPLSHAAPGVALHMAPEQLEGPGPPDPRSDIYSLGVVCYRLLAGRFPHQAATGPELARAIRSQKPAALRAYREDCPLDLEVVLTRALAPDPDLRFQSADEFLNALRAIRAG